MKQPDHNLFAALRAAFPADLDAVAIETDNGLFYTWRDLDQSTAKLANLLASLNLPAGSRIAVQVEKSVEAAMLYLATLRAGYVFLPLNTAYQSGEMEYFVGNAEPALVVCSPQNFGWVSKIAFTAGTQNVFTLGDDRTGSLLDRAAHCSDTHTSVPMQADDLAAILYTSGTTGRSKGAMLTHGNLLSNAQVLKDYWGWKPGDVGKVDERGYTVIVGRSKDLIISGGYNVYPAEIEGYINDMPGVAESALVGVPHPDFGEVGVAVVIAKPGVTLQPDAITAALKASLANFKIPKRCFVVAELPRNTMGKVQKNLLRNQYAGLFTA